MKARSPVLVFLVALLMCALVIPAAAEVPGPQSGAPPRGAAGVDPATGLRQDEKGLWYREGSAVETAAQAPAASGGPDEFGYTWTDTALNWIDAGGGADTGITSNTDGAGPFDIGFPFKFYENTRTQLWVSRYGFVAFSSDALYNSQSPIPSPERPNDVIAPHWVPSYDGINYVRYLRGGTAPNRWLLVEWNDQRSEGNHYTFEAVLYENGNIVFQYAAMTDKGGYCRSSGIEDATGLDGLAVTRFCYGVAPYHAVRIVRPSASARVSLYPRDQGSFGVAGDAASFNQTVRNTGELGVDTFDLYTESPWPTTLYHADGITPLSDTDGDGQPDTGPVDQGSSKSIVVRTQLPAGATVGAGSAAQVTAISSRNPTKQKGARFQATIPAPFASSYSQSGQTTLGYYRPGQQTIRRTGADNSSGYDTAAATLPDGRIVQVWAQGRNLPNNGPWVNELHYALTDNKGNVLRAAARLTDLSGADSSAYDYSPSVAVSPDGRIGVTWYRGRYRNNYAEYNYNIHFLVLDAAGNLLVQPANVTNNDIWFSWSGNTRFEVYDAVIAATPNNRFGIAWQRYTADGSNYANTVWYAVRGADGGVVRGPTQFSNSTRTGDPNLTALADGTLFLSLQTIGNLGYGRLDSAGNVVTPLVTVLGPTIYPSSDAVQLPNGNIIVAWANNAVQYTVLNSSLEVVRDISSLPSISPTGDYNMSVTGSGSQAVLTWGDACCDYNPNLYYALLDANGDVVTPPMIYLSDYANFYVRLPQNGQGATPLIGDKPPQSRAFSPAYITGPIPVSWQQTGGDWPIARYDVWARHGANGAWTKWLDDTTETSAAFTDTYAGDTVYFRSVATDINANVETDVPANGDTSTRVAALDVSGQVTNIRGEPVFAAGVTSSPATALNSARSDARGDYHLFFGSSDGITSLTAGRNGFGAVETRGVDLAALPGPLDFVLPPNPDAIANGGFETGDATGWQAGAWQPAFVPTVRAASAHSGGWGLNFSSTAGQSVKTDGSAPELAYTQGASQTVTVPADAARPTLSLFFRVTRANPDAQLTIKLSTLDIDIEKSVSYSITPRGWTHAIVTLDSWQGQRVNVSISVVGSTPGWDVDVDEVSLGDAGAGAQRTLVPLMRR